MRVPFLPFSVSFLILLSLLASVTKSDIEPRQLIGTYTKIPLPPFSRTCPDGVRIRQVDPISTNEGVFFVISHSRIELPIQGGGTQTCVSVPVNAPVFSDLSATVLERSTQSVLDMTNPLVNAFFVAEEAFFLGIELGPRTCGQSILPADTVSMWVAPDSVITVSIGEYSIIFKKGFKYVYYFSETDPCLYQGNASEQGTIRPIPTPPSPTPTRTPSPTPSPSSLQILSPVPTPVQSPVPSGGTTSPGSSVLDPGVTVTDGIQTPAQQPMQPACFPYDAVVQTRRGAVAIGELSVGDEVIVEKARYSQVFAFTHATRLVWENFVEIRTEKRRLALSRGHYIYVNGRVTRAEDVRKGDYVQDVHDGETVVTKVDTVRKQGLYNPQTVDGNIVVNGLIVTTYTTALGKMMTAHALLTPIRMFRSLFSVDVLLQRIRFACISYYRVCPLL